MAIRVCQHVREGSDALRIANIEGVLYAECGATEHFEDLQKPGSTTLFAAIHLDALLVEELVKLPIGAFAEKTSGQWRITTFKTEQDYEPNGLYAVPKDELSVNFADFFETDSWVGYFSSSGACSILRSERGLRSFPLWGSNGRAEEPIILEKFAPDRPRIIPASELFELFEDCTSIGINFLNLDFNPSEPQSRRQ